MRINWIITLREILSCTNFFDFYEIKSIITRIKVGTIRSATHRKTKTDVDAKIIRKKGLNEQDFELTRREIEIWKMCQHPNIVKFIDVFENPGFIYIISEHYQADDLFAYLEKNAFIISEDKAKTIIHHIATGLWYLHTYGIMHRDIKPENIIMVSESPEIQIKINNFSLSKILASQEKNNEPFGTLSYVAPEIIKGEKYDKSVDLWSLGVVAYLLLSGCLPFDDDKDSEICKKIIFGEAKYDFGKWSQVSKEALDFVKGLLVKDSTKRMSLEETLVHPWLVENTEMKDIRAKHKGECDIFQYFSSIEGMQNKSYKLSIPAC